MEFMQGAMGQCAGVTGWRLELCVGGTGRVALHCLLGQIMKHECGWLVKILGFIWGAPLGSHGGVWEGSDVVRTLWLYRSCLPEGSKRKPLQRPW